MVRFCRLQLRTSDVEAARSFYATLLGEPPRDVVELPAEAAARGARPHWLGLLGVDDVEASAEAFVRCGATRLGPTRAGPIALLRDPGGAVVGLTRTPSAPVEAGVVWHLLNTPALERTLACYTGACGWALGEQLDLGSLGRFHQFAWAPGQPSVGAFADITERPGVHPHWLFQFPVPALEPAMAYVQAEGGLVLGPFELPDGDRVAVCDDPQGAAFALRERV